MRDISQETKDSIVNIFPKENILAIIIFGSFGTERANYNSDIDIAWIPSKKVPITELAIKTQSLRNVLDIDVDLKIVTDKYTVEFRKNIFEGEIIYQSKEFKDYLNNFYIENSDVIDILNWRDMYDRVKNKLAWSSIEAVNRDFGSCLYDLQNFKMLYNKENMPPLWERYIKESFKNYMVSFLELTKAMLYYKTIDLNIKSKNFYDYLLACEYHNLLPKNSAIVIETLRKLRNDDSHGYDIPEFEEMYELFTENEDVFVSIRNSCNSNL